MSQRQAASASAAWTALDGAARDRAWDAFEARFGFRASTQAEGWPAISEPKPSITFDLSGIVDGPRRSSAFDAINAEALRCFVWALAEDTELNALDWQHPAYRFTPARQALAHSPEWPISVYPDGDYYAFLTDDLSEGTFGHPWEQTLCVIGPRLGETLGRSLAVWLPIKRRDGEAT
jgi:hypothetical protein